MPVIGAPYGPFEQVDLAAALYGAGSLGSLGTAVRPLADLRRQWARMRELTDRPFAVNHTLRPLNEEAFRARCVVPSGPVDAPIDRQGH
ncbi:hypothetical protein GCM10010244_82720 [Streptomyces coeruleorubidus]|nr:hypothetical protein GCM10010244_82720 [Streptomyces bellus]